MMCHFKLIYLDQSRETRKEISQHSHFLPNSWVFLEKKIHVYVKITGGDAPGHTPNHL